MPEHASSTPGTVPAVWTQLRGWKRDLRRATMQVYNIAMHVLTLTAYARTGTLDATAFHLFGLVAPAMLVAQAAQFVDLDGPLLLQRDRENGLRYKGTLVHPPAPSSPAVCAPHRFGSRWRKVALTSDLGCSVASSSSRPKII